MVEWVTQTSVLFETCQSVSLRVGLRLFSGIPGPRTFDILGLGDWQALNLVIFMGPLTVKVQLWLHLTVPSATVSIPGDTAMC